MPCSKADTAAPATSGRSGPAGAGAAGEAEPPGPPSGEPGDRRPAVAGLLCLLAIVGGAAALRLALLGDQPGGLWPDEASEGYDAWSLLHVRGFHPLFFSDDGGREVLFGYILAAVFHVAGASVLSLRTTAAVLGILGVIATPLLLRRLGRLAVLAGTAWVAGSLWLVCVDRDGMRNVLVPLVGTLALWRLIEWAAGPGRRTALAAGVACGGGLWTYQPLKLLPVLAALWLVELRRRHAPAWPQLRATLGWAVAGYAAVAAPIAWVVATDPVGYFGRGVAVSAADPHQPLAQLPLHVLRTVGMLGITGDPNPRHDAGGVPLVPLVPAALTVLGAVRAWRGRRHPIGLLALLGLPVFLAPALVAPEGGAPHGLRTLGLVPIIALLVGLGSVELTELAGRRWRRRGSRLAIAAVAAGLGLTAAETATAYFGRGVAQRYSAYSFAAVALAEAAPPGAVVIVDDYDAVTVRFVDNDHQPAIVDPGTRITPPPGTVVLAASHADLERSLGSATASRATVVARDPAGRPVAWRTTA